MVGYLGLPPADVLLFALSRWRFTDRGCGYLLPDWPAGGLASRIQRRVGSPSPSEFDTEPADPSRGWQTGVRGNGGRRRRLRGGSRAARDRSPTWATDLYRDRAAFIRMLVVYLSDADEALRNWRWPTGAEVRQAGVTCRQVPPRYPGARRNGPPRWCRSSRPGYGDG